MYYNVALYCNSVTYMYYNVAQANIEMTLCNLTFEATRAANSCSGKLLFSNRTSLDKIMLEVHVYWNNGVLDEEWTMV